MPRKPKEAPEAAPKEKKKTGRPSKYTVELAKEICKRLANGEPLRQICRDDHMPHWVQIYEWMGKDDLMGGDGVGLSLAIAKAREVGQDAIAEQIWIDMNTPPERILSEGGDRVDSGFVQWQKARAEIGLKLLAKWNPKRYGDRVALAGDASSPIKVEAEVQASKLLEAILTNAELTKKAGE